MQLIIKYLKLDLKMMLISTILLIGGLFLRTLELSPDLTSTVGLMTTVLLFFVITIMLSGSKITAIAYMPYSVKEVRRIYLTRYIEVLIFVSALIYLISPEFLSSATFIASIVISLRGLQLTMKYVRYKGESTGLNVTMEATFVFMAYVIAYLRFYLDRGLPSYEMIVGFMFLGFALSYIINSIIIKKRVKVNEV